MYYLTVKIICSLQPDTREDKPWSKLGLRVPYFLASLKDSPGSRAQHRKNGGHVLPNSENYLQPTT
jgi:hypothetical protein